MRWAEITLTVPPESVEPCSAALTECGSAGVVVVDPAAVSSDPFAGWEATGSPPPRPGASRCTVTGYLPVDDRLEPAMEDLRLRLRAVAECGLDPGDGVALRTLEDEDWVDAWKAYFRPLRVGRRLVVRPPWEPWDAAPDDLAIAIDPGMAFGTGAHPSTRLCLELLEETLRPGSRVLDWGTGSGILAVAAARLGAARVRAIDLDPAAVRAAADNAARNGVSERVLVETASIETLPARPAFDLILANIVADPILRGAAEMRRRLRRGGGVIASGFTDEREPDVAEALAGAGLPLRAARAEGEWRAFYCRAEAGRRQGVS